MKTENKTTVSINGGNAVSLDDFNALANEASRPQHIANTIMDLIAEAIGGQIQDVEESAAEAAGDGDGEGESDKPVTAKLSISVSWEAGKSEPEVSVKSSYSVRRFVELSAVADGKQSKLPL